MLIINLVRYIYENKIYIFLGGVEGFLVKLFNFWEYFAVMFSILVLLKPSKLIKNNIIMILFVNPKYQNLNSFKDLFYLII